MGTKMVKGGTNKRQAFHEAERMAADMETLRGTFAKLAEAFPSPAPRGSGDLEEPEDPLEVDLGDSNTFADIMGCGVVVVEQVDLETGQAHNVVLTEDNLERLLAAVRRTA